MEKFFALQLGGENTGHLPKTQEVLSAPILITKEVARSGIGVRQAGQRGWGGAGWQGTGGK